MKWAGRQGNASYSVLGAALEINASLAIPMGLPEVAGIARHVERYRAKWKAGGWAHCPQWVTRQSARGIASGKARRARVEQRNREIVAARATGASQRAIAEIFGVSQATVFRVLRMSDSRTNTGSPARAPLPDPASRPTGGPL